MEQILDIGGRRFILGLEWIKLAGSDAVLAAKAQAKSRRSPLGVIRTIDIGEGQKLSQVGLSHKKVSGVSYSAAAHLATTNHQMVAIDRINDDLYWICVVENGRVLPGHDIAASDSEIRRIFQDFQAEYQLEYMRLYMPDDVAEELNLGHPFENHSPIGMLENGAVADSTKLKNLAGIPNTHILGAAIATLVIGWIGYSQYGEYLQEQERERQLALESMEEDQRIQAEKERLERLRQQPTDEQLLARARQQEIGWLQEEFNALPLSAVMSEVYKAVDRNPGLIRGWRLEGFMFDQADLKSVSSRWLRGNAKLSDLHDYYKDKASVSYTNDVVTGIVNHPISLKSRNVTDVLDYIAKKGTSYQAFSDKLIEGRHTFKLTPVPELSRKETILGLANKTLEGTPQLIIRKRKFDVSGSSKDSFVSLMKALEPIRNMTPANILVSRVDGGFNWKFSGILHEL